MKELVLEFDLVLAVGFGHSIERCPRPTDCDRPPARGNHVLGGTWTRTGHVDLQKLAKTASFLPCPCLEIFPWLHSPGYVIVVNVNEHVDGHRVSVWVDECSTDQHPRWHVLVVNVSTSLYRGDVVGVVGLHLRHVGRAHERHVFGGGCIDTTAV